VQFGVSVTTKYGTDYLACQGTVTGTKFCAPAGGTVPTGQVYNNSALTETWTPASGAGIYLFQFGGSTKYAVYVGATGIAESANNCSGVTTTTTTTTAAPTTTTTTAAPTTTTTTTVAPITVTGFSAFSYETFGEYEIQVGIILSAGVNQDTIIDALVDTAFGSQYISVTIFSGNSSGTAITTYFSDPAPVGPNCLTFSSGDTRVTTGGLTCP
jgi:hypothetical protein